MRCTHVTRDLVHDTNFLRNSHAIRNLQLFFDYVAHTPLIKSRRLEIVDSTLTNGLV